MYFAEGNTKSDKVVFDNYMTKFYRSQVVASHPVAMAKFFDRLIENLIQFLSKAISYYDNK